jgi:hypothetical protein
MCAMQQCPARPALASEYIITGCSDGVVAPGSGCVLPAAGRGQASTLSESSVTVEWDIVLAPVVYVCYAAVPSQAVCE